MKLSFDEICRLAEPEQVLQVVAPNMPPGQKRHLFWGEFDTDCLVEAHIKRKEILPPVHWRVTVEGKHREGVWDPFPETT